MTWSEGHPRRLARYLVLALVALAAIASFSVVQLVVVVPVALFVGASAANALMLLSLMANNALMYSLPLLLVAWRGGSKRQWLAAAAATLVLAPVIGWGLPAATERSLARFLEEKQSARLAGWSPQAPVRSIALVSNNPSHVTRSGYRGQPRASCGSACQMLLFDGQVEKVVVVLPPRTQSERLLTTAYRVDRRAVCEDVADYAGWILPRVRTRIVAGECLIASDTDEQEAVDATIVDIRLRSQSDELTEDLAWGSEWGRWLSHIEQLRMLAVYAGGRRTGQLVLRHYEIEGSAYAAPLHVVAETCDWCTTTFARRVVKTEVAGTLESTLQVTFGLKLERVKESGPALVKSLYGDAAMARSILAMPEAELPQFTSLQISMLEHFIDPSSGLIKNLPPEEAALLPLLLRDRRVNTDKFLGATFRRTDEMQKLLPEILDRIDAPDPDRDSRTRLGLNAALLHIPTAAIVAAADRLNQLADKAAANPESARYKIGVIARLGDLGSQSLPRLIAFLQSSAPNVSEAAAIGICRLGLPDAKTAIAALTAAFDVNGAQADYNTRDKAIALALIRLGGWSDAQQSRAISRWMVERMDWNAKQGVGR